MSSEDTKKHQFLITDLDTIFKATKHEKAVYFARAVRNCPLLLMVEYIEKPRSLTTSRSSSSAGILRTATATVLMDKAAEFKREFYLRTNGTFIY